MTRLVRIMDSSGKVELVTPLRAARRVLRERSAQPYQWSAADLRAVEAAQEEFTQQQIRRLQQDGVFVAFAPGGEDLEADPAPSSLLGMLGRFFRGGR